jgi:hypothetical protein
LGHRRVARTSRSAACSTAAHKRRRGIFVDRGRGLDDDGRAAEAVAGGTAGEFLHYFSRGK